VAAKTVNTFTLQIEGYATGRDISTVDFQFTPAAGANVVGTTFSLNASGPSGVWFRSGGSQSYGSLFAATVTFTVTVPPGTSIPNSGVTTPSSVDVIDSVTVMLSAASGKSAAISIPVR
jgi:hypothetical protein